jgi:hypothetical protein
MLLAEDQLKLGGLALGKYFSFPPENLEPGV